MASKMTEILHFWILKTLRIWFVFYLGGCLFKRHQAQYQGLTRVTGAAVATMKGTSSQFHRRPGVESRRWILPDIRRDITMPCILNWCLQKNVCRHPSQNFFSGCFHLLFSFLFPYIHPSRNPKYSCLRASLLNQYPSSPLENALEYSVTWLHLALLSVPTQSSNGLGPLSSLPAHLKMTKSDILNDVEC